MQRVGIYFRLKPNMIDEYIRRHDNIWPEMTEALNKSGIHNYSIWNFEDKLFAYFETEGYNLSQEYLNENEVYTRWRKYMEDVIYINPEDGKKEYEMKLAFYHK